jgi:hypothetical protein
VLRNAASARPSRIATAGAGGRASRARGWRDCVRLAVVLALTVAPAGAAEPGASSTQCGAVKARTLTLLVVNEAGVAPELLSTATAEASAIWERAAVRLSSTFAPAASAATGARTLVVTLRNGISHAADPMRRWVGCTSMPTNGRGTRLSCRSTRSQRSPGRGWRWICESERCPTTSRRRCSDEPWGGSSPTRLDTG